MLLENSYPYNTIKTEIEVVEIDSDLNLIKYEIVFERCNILIYSWYFDGSSIFFYKHWNENGKMKFYQLSVKLVIIVYFLIEKFSENPKNFTICQA